MKQEPAAELSTLQRMHNLMRQVSSTHDLREILQTIADGVADVVGFEIAVIRYLNDDGMLECLAVAGADDAREQLLGSKTPVDQFLAEFDLADEWGILRFVPHYRLPESGGPGWIPDLAVSDDPNAWHPEDALFAPLSAPTGELIGMMAVDVPKDRRIPGKFQREVLEMYAVEAGIAINNAKQRARLAEQVRLASAVRTVMSTAGGDLDLDRLVEDSVKPVAEGLRARRMWIRAFADDSDRGAESRGGMYPPGELPTGSDELTATARAAAIQCWAEQRVAVSTTAAPDPESRLDAPAAAEISARLHDSGEETLLFVPMGAGPQCLGYFVLTRTSEDPSWSAEETEAALEIGRELGRAVMHARLLERERQIVDELQALDRYKTQLIATISHELRNPLTSIMGHVELLETADLPHGTQQSLAAIGRNAGRLESLVDDLLLLSKVADPHRPLAPVEVDLTALVDEALDLLRVQADQRDLLLHHTISERPVTVWGERAELDRVVTNLVGNAVKYSPDGGTVTVAVSRGEERALLEVADEGLGISAEDQEQLFTEFFRSTNPDAVALPGTGLGLTIVQRIVERHHGSIDVESELGKGSTFRVTLPLRPARLSGGDPGL